MNVRKLLEGLWADELENLAEAEARAKGRALLESFLLERQSKVISRVKKRGPESIREALYHLWAVRFGGELGDRIRDLQETKIIAAVAPDITNATPKAQVVRLVAQSVAELVF